MARSQRWVRKVTQLLANSGVKLSQTPTNILFVSNSSVMCGVEFETLESVFQEFDPNSDFVVYPKHKSYSFVVLSNIDKAIQAQFKLDNSTPTGFPKEIAVFFVTNLPKDEENVKNKSVDGLKVIHNFVSLNEQNQLVELLGSYKSNFLKNRQVIHFGYKFNYSENNAFEPAQSIPPFLNQLIAKIIQQISTNSIENLQSFKPDQITVNIYNPGQGIPPHVDTHSAFEEPIISLSLLSDIVMEFRDCANLRNLINVLLPSQCLLIMTREARYRFKHGILNRKYDVNPLTNRIINRQKRISITFRQIRKRPCDCKFIEFCDWDRSGKMAIPKTNLDGQNLENEYVSKVYEEIADHFDETRRSNWGVVNKFLDMLPENSVVVDAGCGNGKYLIRKDSLCKIGGDLCRNLVKIAYLKNCNVFQADVLSFPIRDCSVDAVISIAVIHHFSTRERRKRALSELQRILRLGGLACVTVWALDQELHTVSVYSKSRKLKDEIDEIENFNKDSTKRLFVHDGRSNFSQQDMLVPWNSKNCLDESSLASTRQFLRYYHLFAKGELLELVQELPECRVKHVEFEEGNWAVIFEKI